VTTGNFAELLWEAADRESGHPAIVERDGREDLDYGALRDRAAAIAGALQAARVAPGDRVAVLLERGSTAAAAYFGALAAGTAAVIVNEQLRPRQIEHVLAHAGARHLLTTAEILDRLPRPLRTEVFVLDVRAIRSTPTFSPIARDERDLAQIIYTSGSTGLPKGVMVSHGNLRAAATTVVGYLDITAGDRIAGLLPFGFVYGLSQLLCAVHAGATLVVDRSVLPDQIARMVAERGVTVLAGVPALWLRLLRTEVFRWEPLPALRVMTNAGGRLPVEAVRALRRAHPGARLFLMYGLTEVLRSTFLAPEEVDRRPDSIGRAVPGAEVLVLNEAGLPTGPGEVGELVHGGPTVTLGYWRDPELTARVFRAHPLRAEDPGARVVFSGDLVRRDADGFLYYVGRTDRIIKTLGYRVGPDEIGEVLYASGEVAEAAVTGEPDPEWEGGARIVAHVVLSAEGSFARLRAYCIRELPRFMQPARYVLHESLPLLPSGKHDVAALAAGSARG
jgi:amino acid adenylation domain-containing protein